MKSRPELGGALFLVDGGRFGFSMRMWKTPGLEERGPTRAARGLAHGFAKRLGPIPVAGDEKRLAAEAEAHGRAALFRKRGSEKAGLGRGPRDAASPLAEGLATLAPA